MTTSSEFMDAIKQRHSIPSDYALAPVLGVTKQEISKLRNRKAFIGDTTALRVAELLSIDPAQVIASAHAERAKRPEERAVWESIIERLRAAATGSTSARNPGDQDDKKGALHIMSNRLAARFFDVLLPPFLINNFNGLTCSID